MVRCLIRWPVLTGWILTVREEVPVACLPLTHRWADIPGTRIGLIVTQRCTRCGKTRVRVL